VPDGTAAMVRCPACKTVFAPTAGLVPTQESPSAQSTPRKRTSADADTTETRRSVAPDFIPPEEKPRKRRPTQQDTANRLSPEERALLKRAFGRAAWGAKLIWISFALFALAMFLIIGYWFQIAFTDPSTAFIIAAGAVGAVYWTLGAVGVGLCASGPRSPGHVGYAIAAAIATGIHLILLAVLVGQGTEISHGRTHRDDLELRWSLVPTQLDTLTFYLSFLFYRGEDLVPKIETAFPVIVGLAELVRNLLVLMLLSCLARAAGDEELSHRCTRAAGFASFGPGSLSIVTFLFVAALVETNAQSTTFAKILFSTLEMGVYAILMGMLFPALVVARETGDVCEEPFQSQLPRL
jgi:hypothetical protein